MRSRRSEVKAMARWGALYHPDPMCSLSRESVKQFSVEMLNADLDCFCTKAAELCDSVFKSENRRFTIKMAKKMLRFADVVLNEMERRGINGPAGTPDHGDAQKGDKHRPVRAVHRRGLVI